MGLCGLVFEEIFEIAMAECNTLYITIKMISLPTNMSPNVRKNSAYFLNYSCLNIHDFLTLILFINMTQV